MRQSGKRTFGGLCVWLLALAWPPSVAIAQEAPSYRSLTGAFASFAESTAAMPMAERIAVFHARLAPLFPAFYRPRDGRTRANLDAMVASALIHFPADRAGYDAVGTAFDRTYRTEYARFREAFPGFRLTAKVYLLHSLGEMDAGTRMIGGKRVLIFAADGIATADSPDALPMLLDHEFFHMMHTQSFPGCFAVWCTLWREGLAVYATSLLNPAASEHQLGLDNQAGVLLRTAVEQDRRGALCLLQSKLGSADRRAIRLFFLAGGGAGTLPPRFGYYLGYRIAQRAGQTHSLSTMMRLPPKDARRLIVETIGTMADEAGGCAAATVAAQP